MVFIAAILFLLICSAVVLLILRFAAKLSWPIAFVIALVAGLILAFFGTRMTRAGTGAHASFMVGLGFLVWLGACVGIIIAYFFRWIANSGDSAVVNTTERARILKMVEDGKISSEEGSELLDAMGRSSALQGQDKFSRLDVVMLCGIALVVLGFFLPWAYFLPQMPGLFGGSSYQDQAGYDVSAIGWAVLIVAVASAIPIFITPRGFLYKISMLQIFLVLIGLVLVVSILVRAGDRLGVGLILCLIGFLVELVGSASKLIRLRM
jgi:hypothetical protein